MHPRCTIYFENIKGMRELCVHVVLIFSKTDIRYKKKKKKREERKEKKNSRGGQIIPKLEIETSPGKQSKVCEEKKIILKTVL